ncbi:MAG: hypothetical protein ABI638_02155 [Ignavibacteriota bacterium]
MYYVLNITVLLLWSLGFVAPYTIVSFVGILLMNLFLNLLLKKILKMSSIKTLQNKTAILKDNLKNRFEIIFPLQ